MGWSLLLDDALASLFNDFTKRTIKWVLRMYAIWQEHCSCIFCITLCNLNCYTKLC
jgi:hypothetical protein